jgi:hypothetical protein
MLSKATFARAIKRIEDFLTKICEGVLRRSAAKLLTKDDARRIAANIAKMPDLLRKSEALYPRTFLLITSEVMRPRFLNKDEFAQVVRNTPLVATDLFVSRMQNRRNSQLDRQCCTSCAVMKR